MNFFKTVALASDCVIVNNVAPYPTHVREQAVY